MYNGAQDPDEHLSIFAGASKVEQWSMPVWCHMFVQILVEAERLWLDSLPAESVTDFEDLQQKFR